MCLSVVQYSPVETAPSLKCFLRNQLNSVKSFFSSSKDILMQTTGMPLHESKPAGTAGQDDSADRQVESKKTSIQTEGSFH